MNLVALVPTKLTPDRVPALILANRDKRLVEASLQAAAQLQRLVLCMTHADLLRLVAGLPDAERQLVDLGESAAATLKALLSERAESAELMRVDDLLRRSKDTAAMELLGQAQEVVATSLSIADTSESETASFRQSLIGAGLSAQEIDRIVAERIAAGQPAAAFHRAAAAAAQARVDQLTAFLKDPLRNGEGLQASLAADLEARMLAPAMRQAHVASVIAAHGRAVARKFSAQVPSSQAEGVPAAADVAG